MAEETMQTVELQDNFYRDGFTKVIVLISSIIIAICLLGITSAYIFLTAPPPQYFRVTDEFRIQPEVPVTQPYLPVPAVLQWVSDTLQQVFVLDFVHYDQQLQSYRMHFTDQGWTVFSNQLNNYVNYNTVKSAMLFSNTTPGGAPFIVNQGVLSGRYAWWVQMPIDITFQGVGAVPGRSLTLQVLVVRVSTKDNLSGVAIDNVIVVDGAGGAAKKNQQQGEE